MISLDILDFPLSFPRTLLFSGMVLKKSHLNWLNLRPIFPLSFHFPSFPKTLLKQFPFVKPLLHAVVCTALVDIIKLFAVPWILSTKKLEPPKVAVLLCDLLLIKHNWAISNRKILTNQSSWNIIEDQKKSQRRLYSTPNSSTGADSARKI